MKSGKVFVVDVDLEKYFDSVNHDRLMSRLSKAINDKRVLALIRRYLTADLLQNGLVEQRQKGAPQGGPLSPLLSNIVLDELDKELERRGHTFCRYADDCNIYVSSQAAAERVMAGVKGFIESKLKLKLKLKVNDLKSTSALVSERQFLGYRILTNGNLTLSPKTQSCMKRRVRELTYRKRGRLSRNPVINQALSNAWFKAQGLYSLRENYELLNLSSEPPYATNARTVV